MKTKRLILAAAGLLTTGFCLGTLGVLGVLWSVLTPQPTANATDAPTSGAVAFATATSSTTPTPVVNATATRGSTLTVGGTISVTSKQPSTPTAVSPTPLRLTPTVAFATFGCPGSLGSRYLFDDFGNAQSGWGIHRGTDYEIFYTDGELHFQVPPSRPPVFTWKLLRDLGTRYRIEVQARNMGGSNKNAYGILFGGQSDTTYDYFLIDDTGSYQVIKKADGRTYELAAWSKTPFINPGGWNYVGLRVEGTQVTFCVNGNVLTVISDLSLESGRVGMAAGSFEELVHIHFDNFSVWKQD